MTYACTYKIIYLLPLSRLGNRVHAFVGMLPSFNFRLLNVIFYGYPFKIIAYLNKNACLQGAFNAYKNFSIAFTFLDFTSTTDSWITSRRYFIHSLSVNIFYTNFLINECCVFDVGSKIRLVLEFLKQPALLNKL